MWKIIRATREHISQIAPLIADFRVALKSYTGIQAVPNCSAAAEEAAEYLDADFPIYAAVEDMHFVGYMVCRVEKPCVWVESIYVEETGRRRGIASALFAEAEKLAASYGQETVYNYVHPNNDGMIAFLRQHGYTVLNLIEIRKPRAGETLSRKIHVETQEFDY